MVIAPLLPAFTERYPGLRIEIVASNRYTDLLEGGVDVAIRNQGSEADSGITVRRLAETKRVLAASPQVLQRHGTPRTPTDLARHRLPIYNLAHQPHQLRLVPVLTDWELPRLTMNIAYPTHRHLPAKLRCFVDFLVEPLADRAFERRWTA